MKWVGMDQQFVSYICNFIILHKINFDACDFFVPHNHVSHTITESNILLPRVHIIVSKDTHLKNVAQKGTIRHLGMWNKNPNQPAYLSSLVMIYLLVSIVFESQGTKKITIKTLTSPHCCTD